MQEAPCGFKIIFGACNIKDVAATAKLNHFDFAALLQQQKYVSATKFSRISTRPFVWNAFSATKWNMMIDFEEFLCLFDESLTYTEKVNNHDN